ncbi:MAG: 50S ribosomal protein L5 [Myxococcales bacterium]|jgi:large subunit ribosomal protein L5|nr:MAG: 50S ribosomal protein L5 [Myxococcales bacterium]
MSDKHKPRLAERYATEVRGALKEQFGLTSVMAVPRLQKIVLNIGVGEAVQNPKLIDQAVNDLTRIAGQKPVVARARKAIANFKLREGMPIGVSVTLRRDRMYEFLDRLIGVVLPRVRDFRGLNERAFDGRGNYSLGLSEQIIFPEIDLDTVEKTMGLSVTIVTTAPNDEQGRALLRAMGLPLRTS